MKICKN